MHTPFGTQYQYVDVDIDEATLKTIAETTGGVYFRATDNKTLQDIYTEIDQLEKSKISVSNHHKREELYHWFVLVLLVCLLSEMLLRQTVFKSIP
jgi:Ca-activated chloride channel family protein